MQTLAEYKEQFKGSQGIDTHGDMVLWFNAIDMMAHVLKFDITDTFFPNTTSPNTSYRDILREEIDKARDDFEAFTEAYNNAYIPVRKFKPHASENDGDLNVSAYINGDKKLFERLEEVIEESKAAITIYINFGLNYSERRQNTIPQYYEQAYRIAATCESENRPCRVIGTYALISETQQHVIRMAVVLKDYNDPIFPAIWAGISNNRVAHALCCCIPYYLLGTRDGSIGVAVTFDVSDISDGDEVFMFGGKLVNRNSNI